MREGIGTRARRVDGEPKVTGAFVYGSDLATDGMLWGVTVRSPHASARIRAVDTERARHSAGRRRGAHGGRPARPQDASGSSSATSRCSPADVVRYAGEPVALVAAATLDEAREAAALVAVDYEPLPPVTDMEEALRDDAPRVHEFGNVLRHVHIVRGDPRAEAEVWVEGYYETAMQDHAALGPEAGLAVPREDGGVDVFAISQWLHVDRQQIAPCLGLPEEQVHLTLAGVGGAFGSREDLHVQIHAALLALRTRAR